MSYDDDDLPRQRNTCVHGMREVSCRYCGPKTPTGVPGSDVPGGAQSGIPQPTCVGCHEVMRFGTFYKKHRSCTQAMKDNPVLQRREMARLARKKVAAARGLRDPIDLSKVCRNVDLDHFSSVEITDQRSFIIYLGTTAWESWGADLLAAL